MFCNVTFLLLNLIRKGAMEAILTFNGQKHEYDKLLKLAANGPSITVASCDVVLDVDDLIAPAVQNTKAVVFYHREGKYVVLVGRDLVKQMLDGGSSIKGQLISGPALKKARVNRTVVMEVPVSPTRGSYGDRSASQSRPPRYQHG